MRVADLIEILSEMDPDGEVLFVHQPAWPFEVTVAKVLSREDLLRWKAQVRGENPDEAVERWDNHAGRLTDVLLVEGEQLRYGDTDVFEAEGFEG